MGSKELIAGTLAIAGALTLQRAVAENSEIQPVEPKVLNAAIDCIKNANLEKLLD